MRIIFLGNCQTKPLAQYINPYNNYLIKYVLVHELNQEQMKQIFSQIGNFDIVFSQLLGQRFGALATANIEQT